MQVFHLFFIYIQQAGINITFTGNTAWFGSAIYISSITACSWTGNTQPYFNRSYFPQWPIFFIRYIEYIFTISTYISISLFLLSIFLISFLLILCKSILLTEYWMFRDDNVNTGFTDSRNQDNSIVTSAETVSVSSVQVQHILER